MTIRFTVWTGSKFKGAWGAKDAALRYMAARAPEESADWLLVPVDLHNNLNADVPAMVKVLAAEAAAAKAARTGATVHELHAAGVEVKSKGRVG